MFKYSVSIKWSDEDGGFIATVSELPGLSAFGKTQEEAISELKVAAEAYLETLEESGEPLPAPKKLVPYSGQIRLRMPKRLHAKLAAAAESEGVSLNTYIVSLLSERQGKKEATQHIRELIKITQSRHIILHGGTVAKFPQVEEQKPISSSEKYFNQRSGIGYG